MEMSRDAGSIPAASTRWDDLSLGIAKAIGDGRPDYRVERLHPDPYEYVPFVAAVAKASPSIALRTAL
jgi:hypothetical protein